MEAERFTLTVNGAVRDVPTDPARSLLVALRDDLGLTGPKPGCGEGACGACTVLLDHRTVRACTFPLADAHGVRIETVEGLCAAGLPESAQALVEAAAPQCGYCMPGMVTAIEGALRAGAGTAPEVIAALDGNLCRCGTYPRIRRAIDALFDPARQGIPAAEPPDDEPELVAPGSLPRPAVPWDLTDPSERAYGALLGPGLTVVLPAQALERGRGRAFWTTPGGAWLHVGEDGLVTAFTGKVDVGQANGTALARLVAEELRVPAASVRLVMGDTDVCPWDMGTFGSRSTPDAGSVLRITAAAARDALVRLAAGRLEAAPTDLTAEDGAVRSRDGARRMAYADLVAGTQQLELASLAAKLTEPGAWRVAGAPTRRTAPAVGMVAGRSVYATDIARPGMLHGRVLQPPQAGARLRSLDVAAAEAMPGVRVVREADGFTGVVAADSATADAAIGVLGRDAAWELPPDLPSDADLVAWVRSHPTDAFDWDGPMDDVRGDPQSAMARAATRFTATYTAAPIAHVPLETHAAVAEWDGNRVTVWVGTQRPFGAREDVATRLGLDEAAVRIVVPATGGAYGGKHGGDVAAEAAILARAAGRPVKVRWSRADEFVAGYGRPAAVIDVRAALGADGRVSAWDAATWNAGTPGIETPYAIPHVRLRFHPSQPPIRQGSYRALAATANTFAREVAMDELAGLADTDPLAFRLSHLADERLAAVLVAAAGGVGWTAANGRPDVGPRRGLGIACGTEKDGYVATAALVGMGEDGSPAVERLVTAFDCGAIVDPDGLRGQIEGATVMALGGALFEHLVVERGRIANPSLNAYRVPRFSDVPPIEVMLIDRRDIPPAGAGESPLIAVAPAIANAVAVAAGRRIRSMPLSADIGAAPR